MPSNKHILHFVFCKIKDSEDAKDGFNRFCYELAELTQGVSNSCGGERRLINCGLVKGGLGEWPGRLMHFGPVFPSKLSRGYTHGALTSTPPIRKFGADASWVVSWIK